MTGLLVGRAKSRLLPLQRVARAAVATVSVTAPALLHVHHVFSFVRGTVLWHFARAPVHGVLRASRTLAPDDGDQDKKRIVIRGRQAGQEGAQLLSSGVKPVVHGQTAVSLGTVGDRNEIDEQIKHKRAPLTYVCQNFPAKKWKVNEDLRPVDTKRRGTRTLLT